MVTVNLTGVPDVKVTWLVNDMPIESDDVAIESSNSYSRLTWKNVTPQSAGVVKVTAENEAGSASVSLNLTVIDRPSPPEDLTISKIEKDAVTVKWHAPKSDGGSKIMGYIVEKMDVKRGTWISAGTTKPGKTELSIAKLTTGNEYLIRVFAENDVGASEPLALDSPVIPKNPFSEPSAPRNLVCEEITANSCKLLWDEPESDGKAPISGYVVEKRSQFNSRWTKVNKTAQPSRSITVLDLVEGTDYEFRVYAENTAGTGPPCEPIGPITAQPPKGEFMSFIKCFYRLEQY